MGRKPNSKCSVCEKEIYRRPNEIAQSKSGKIFCSHVCFTSISKIEKTCPVCNKTFSGSGRKTCSRTCSNKNRTGITYGNGQQNNKTLRFRRLKQTLIDERGPICEECKFDKVIILQVHHVIERCNGGTDELSNLKLLCPNCHYMKHTRRGSGMDEDIGLNPTAL
jgi:5-methylcytosine-specific restriction endonuclease McrA